MNYVDIPRFARFPYNDLPISVHRIYLTDVYYMSVVGPPLLGSMSGS